MSESGGAGRAAGDSGCTAPAAASGRLGGRWQGGAGRGCRGGGLACLRVPGLQAHATPVAVALLKLKLAIRHLPLLLLILILLLLPWLLLLAPLRTHGAAVPPRGPQLLPAGGVGGGGGAGPGRCPPLALLQLPVHTGMHADSGWAHRGGSGAVWAAQDSTTLKHCCASAPRFQMMFEGHAAPNDTAGSGKHGCIRVPAGEENPGRKELGALGLGPPPASLLRLLVFSDACGVQKLALICALGAHTFNSLL